MRGSGFALLADLGRLAGALAEEVELGATHLTAMHEFDLGNSGAVLGERALDTDAVAEFAHRVGLGDTRSLDRDDVALENLNALFAAFNDAHVNLHFVAGAKVGQVAAEVLIVDEVGGLHGAIRYWSGAGVPPE